MQLPALSIACRNLVHQFLSRPSDSRSDQRPHSSFRCLRLLVLRLVPSVPLQLVRLMRRGPFLWTQISMRGAGEIGKRQYLRHLAC
jgi:hypothetical protein